MFKTGELSKIFGIDRTSLSYYVKMGLLSPEVQDNQYFQYSVEDVIALSYIRYYRGLGFNMNQIKSLTQDADHEMKIDFFDERMNLIHDEIRFLQMKLRFLEHLKNSVQFFSDYCNDPVLMETEGYYFVRKEDIHDSFLKDLYKMIPSSEFEMVFDDDYNISIQTISSSQGLALKEAWVQEFELELPENSLYYPSEMKCLVSWNVDHKNLKEQTKKSIEQVIKLCEKNGYKVKKNFVVYVMINHYHQDRESYDVFAQFSLKSLD